MPADDPKVVATVTKDRHHLFIAKCPYCRKPHWHGSGGPDAPEPRYGHRWSHCERKGEGWQGYFLVPPMGQVGWPRK